MNVDVWLRLLYLETFSADKLFAILAQSVSLKDLLTSSLPKLMALGFTQPQAERWQTINEDDLNQAKRWLEKPEHSLVTILDVDYPTLLKEIPDPPIALFVQGNKGLLASLQLAIVGQLVWVKKRHLPLPTTLLVLILLLPVAWRPVSMQRHIVALSMPVATRLQCVVLA